MRLAIFILCLAVGDTAFSSEKSELKDRGKFMQNSFKDWWDSRGFTGDECWVGFSVAADKQTIISLGAAAEKAGVKEGDILLKQDGLSAEQLETTKGTAVKVGEDTTLILKRDGKKVSITLPCPHSREEMKNVYDKHFAAMAKGDGKKCAQTVAELCWQFGASVQRGDEYLDCKREEFSRGGWEQDELANAQSLYFESVMATIDHASYDELALKKLKTDVTKWITALESMGQNRYARKVEEEYLLALAAYSASPPVRSGGDVASASQGSCFFASRDGAVDMEVETLKIEEQRSRSLKGRIVDDEYLTWDGTVRIRLPFLAQPGAKIEARQLTQQKSGLFMFDDFGSVYIVLITVNNNPSFTIEDINRDFQTPYELLDKKMLTTDRGKELRVKVFRKGGSHLTSDTYEGGKQIESAQLDLIDATAIFLAGANKDIIEVTAGETNLSLLIQTDRDPKEEVNRLADLAEKRLEEFLSGVEID